MFFFLLRCGLSMAKFYYYLMMMFCQCAKTTHTDRRVQTGHSECRGHRGLLLRRDASSGATEVKYTFMILYH